eukprot:CCRYP_002718-RA/>CCRYP_002718-RA protein AED:0.05 eAED:0.05 QI:184/1/1/1/0.85/0.87/8/1136/994
MASHQGEAPSRPKRTKMLSFEPNADFFVIDEHSTPSAAATANVIEGRRSRQSSHENRPRPSPNANPPELMGPLLRRKKVVSMPLGDPRRNDFFATADRGGLLVPISTPAASGVIDEGASATEDGSLGPLPNITTQRVARRQRQHTAPATGGFFQIDSISAAGAGTGGMTAGGVVPTRLSGRKKTNSFMAGLLARKAVGLDLLPSEEAELGVYEFFNPPKEEEEGGQAVLTPMPGSLDQGEETKEETAEEGLEGAAADSAAVEPNREISDDSFKEQVEVTPKPKLFKPLVFAPRIIPKGTATGHGAHGGAGHGMPSPPSSPQKEIEEKGTPSEVVVAAEAEKAIALTNFSSGKDDSPQKDVDDTFGHGYDEDAASCDDLIEKFDDSHIIRATRKDYFYTGILFIVMCAFVGVILGWDTHLDESDSIFGPVGLACRTPCRGDLYDQDYFRGQYQFATNDVILLVSHIDTTLTENSFLQLSIRGVTSNKTKWVSPSDLFGPGSVEGERVSVTDRVVVNWENPGEPHVIDIVSTTGNQEIPPAYYDAPYNVELFENTTDAADSATHEVNSSSSHRLLSSGGEVDVYSLPSVPHHGELTFNLYAATLHPIAGSSVLIAGLIMIFVYIFILLEVIHRTLVAILGSLVALFFFFMMHGGHTESISTLMLHMEWSTLGLLFGMMLLVGELSHTGVFEWCAVRLLIMSKGSFNRLMVLLCGLVGLSSAFLDNVTTMLLIAPVTIDMCNILGVDPRPYLIGEVLLSNVGGTATLIGDPPNIIIGSSFDEVGFVDFIINVLPCIFFFCVPVSLFLIVKIYKYYLTSEKMVTLDVRQLKKTYQVYDEPRLLIAGTSTFFVILLFFLHPLHHKDTAWIALLGAFITIAFTNPHDVQDALRNHVEWDTLLFFAGLFVLVEVCAAMGLLQAIGNALAAVIKSQPEENQLAIAITLILWVSAITSAFLDNIPYTATMIPVVTILANELPETLDVKTLAWALSFGACRKLS